MNRWRFLLSQLTGELWPRAALYAALGVGVALLAAWFSPLVPKSLAKPFGGGTVTGLMSIMASSLLTVATFSAAAMLTAFTNVSQGATPRAARLVAGNRGAQGALATFVGAFIYAVVGYSALGTGYYGAGGRAILFFVTLLVLTVVAVTLLRWLDQLLRLARVDNVIAAVERETATAMEGHFGAGSADRGRVSVPPNAAPILAGKVGYVQNVDIGALSALAAEAHLRIWITAPPGTFTVPDTVLAEASGHPSEEMVRRLRKAFTMGVERSFSQDPQFGLIVLSEIASHALSPAVNNPGIAKDVITSIVLLLDRWMALKKPSQIPAADGVSWSGIDFADLIDDALLPISIDGAASLTVAVRLQNVLAALRRSARPAHRDVLARFAREALTRSESALDHEPDRVRVREAAGSIVEAAR